MPICAQPDSAGVLHTVEVPSMAECPGYVLVTPTDSIAFLERIFDPSFVTPEQYETMFQLGFVTPVLAYLVAWAFQTVINFLEKDDL
ncbi:MAG: hypothetical protein ACK4XG_00025 [Chromatiaceae bacterium]|jgi:hypothetical protein